MKEDLYTDLVTRAEQMRAAGLELQAEVSALCPPCTGNCRQGRDCRADEPPFHWADGFVALIGVGFLALLIFGVLS
ncbi:MAG: hypothetical protein V4792_09885 [Pseudomonadota bacterium]